MQINSGFWRKCNYILQMIMNKPTYVVPTHRNQSLISTLLVHIYINFSHAIIRLYNLNIFLKRYTGFCQILYQSENWWHHHQWICLSSERLTVSIWTFVLSIILAYRHFVHSLIPSLWILTVINAFVMIFECD